MQLSDRLNKIASDFRLAGAQTAGLAIAACVLLDANGDVVLDGRDLSSSMGRLRTASPDPDSVFLAAKDTDGTLAANSDAKVATQKATKTYADGRYTAAVAAAGAYADGRYTAAVAAAAAAAATVLAGGTAVFVPPTTDPGVLGALWNDDGTLSLSAG